MATAALFQSIFELGTLQTGTAVLYQSIFELGVLPGSPTPPNPTLPPTGGNPTGTTCRPPCSDFFSTRFRALWTKRKRDQWPYPWEFPPPGTQHVKPHGTIAAPAIGTQALILQFTVPTGFCFALRGILITAPGVWLPGQSTWIVDLNQPLGGSAPQGRPLEYFNAIDTPLGSAERGPWKIDPVVIADDEVIRVKVTTTAAVIPGAPNYFSASLHGWLWADPEE